MGEPGSARTLYLVDGTYTVFRSFYAIAGLRAPDGTPTNGVFGFLSTVRKLVRERSPDHFGVAFDVEGPTHRDGMFAEYKANRPAPPEDLVPQFELAMEACRAMGWPVLTAPGFEADDVLATLTARAREAGLDVVIVTSDKDLYQLVGERVTVLNPSKDDRMLDPAGVNEVFGVLPEHVVDVLALMGDAVDNVPGVPGIGEKTARSLVQRYGGVEDVLRRATLFGAACAARESTLAALDAGDAQALAPALGALTAAARELAALEERLGGEPAADLVARFGALAALAPGTPEKALRRALGELDRKTQPKVWLSLASHADAARLSRELVVIRTDAPVPLDLDAMHPQRPDVATALALFRRLGFRTLAAEMEGRLTGAATADARADAQADAQAEAKAEAEAEGGDEAGGKAGAAPSLFDEPVVEVQAPPVSAVAPGGEAEAVALVETERDLVELVARCRAAARTGIAVDLGAHEPRRAPLLGIALAPADGAAAYVALGRPLAPDAVLGALAPFLADAAAPKAGHDLKPAVAALARAGAPVAGLAFDTLLAGQLLEPDRAAPPRLDELAARWLGRTAAPVAPDAALGDLDPQRLARAAVAAACAAADLVAPLTEALRRDDLLELFETVEMPLLPVLERAEAAGIRIDTAALAAMSARLDHDLEALEREIHALAGRPFNVNSPPQLRAVLFDELQLSPTGRRTQKTRVHSTREDVLEALAEVHPLPAKVLQYRELAKLKGTYVDALPRLVDPADGRVHTRFNQLGAATGRLSSTDPNLQNIPVRSETGRLIRAAFVPAAGCRFLSADYSQMELRILAHLADDPQLIEAFERDLDIHRYTAALVAGIALEDVTSELRARAKAVNFGIVYGMSEYRLARDQGMSVEEARTFIEAYFARYPRVREYIDATIGRVQQTGEVRTLFGRVRRFPDLLPGASGRLTRPARDALLRQAVNATVQGTGADIVKRAMVALYRALRESGLAARLLLQVHDELLLEAPADELPVLRQIVRRAMEGAARLSVPLKVDLGEADTWAKGH